MREKDVEHILKGHELRIDEMKSKVPEVFKQLGLETVRASQEYYLDEMEKAVDYCDVLNFARNFGNERHWDCRLDNALIEGKLIEKASDRERIEIHKDAEENIMRISNALTKWSKTCSCNRKDLFNKADYNYAVKRISDYMDHHGKYEKPKRGFDAFQASLIIAYMFGVEKEKALEDIMRYREKK